MVMEDHAKEIEDLTLVPVCVGPHIGKRGQERVGSVQGHLESDAMTQLQGAKIGDKVQMIRWGIRARFKFEIVEVQALVFA